MRTFVYAVLKTVTVYSFLGWLYVAATALAQPQTLPIQLTHLEPWPRTDVFGEICFGVSFVGFFLLQLLRGWPERASAATHRRTEPDRTGPLPDPQP